VVDAAESTNQQYLLANADAAAGERLDALSALFNPTTFQHMRNLGIRPGWRVWEVGAGNRSIPSWLAQEAGAEVLATDIDTRLLGESDDDIEVRVHDIAVDDADEEQFDFVHARLVLVHVTDRDRALDTMIRSLKPGGWLLVEDADPQLQPLTCLDERGPREVLANRLKRQFRTLLAARGVDLAFGRTLPSRLRAAGLTNVGADAYFPLGGPLCAALELQTLEQIASRLLDAGLATADEIAAHRDAIESGELDFTVSPLISAWGQRPAAN